jgi:hypothetical protein
MSLTYVTITGTFKSPDGYAAHGWINFELFETLVNGALSIEPKVVRGIINDAGLLVSSSGGSLQLAANDDAATVPQGTYYWVTKQIAGAPEKAFGVIIQHAWAPSVDFSILEPDD